MILVSRLNSKEFYVNPDLIELMEETPDTIITLTTGKKLVVEETTEELIARIVAYRREIFMQLPRASAADADGADTGAAEPPCVSAGDAQ